MNITVRYNVFGLDEEDAQELEMEVSDRQYDRLESYEEDGELLDEDLHICGDDEFVYEIVL